MYTLPHTKKNINIYVELDWQELLYVFTKQKKIYN